MLVAFDHFETRFETPFNVFHLISFVLLPDTFVALNGKSLACTVEAIK